MKEAREKFVQEIKMLDGKNLIFLDETGCVTGMSRTHSYAPCGKRAVSFEPACKGTRLSLTGALSLNGFIGGLEVEGTINGDVFETFINDVLRPHLCHGKVVLLDNISFHHRESIKEIIEGTGAQVKFLPAYSPEFNPIEECWSKLKAWLRKKAARTVEELRNAITEAINRITAKDSGGWFQHAGYQVQVQ